MARAAPVRRPRLPREEGRSPRDPESMAATGGRSTTSRRASHLSRPGHAGTASWNVGTGARRPGRRMAREFSLDDVVRAKSTTCGTRRRVPFRLGRSSWATRRGPLAFFRSARRRRRARRRLWQAWSLLHEIDRIGDDLRPRAPRRLRGAGPDERRTDGAGPLSRALRRSASIRNSGAAPRTSTGADARQPPTLAVSDNVGCSGSMRRALREPNRPQTRAQSVVRARLEAQSRAAQPQAGAHDEEIGRRDVGLEPGEPRWSSPPGRSRGPATVCPGRRGDPA
jgi:hypothetical protein